ncbi:uncharacterized protein LOC119060504 [Artibeus jamaicensis]|uniref:uncharacterized protein LOC119060504 n=1 Tax=Artibeus jamaicensis TaxID=9417 RepID=UPI00235AEFD2|nr:uncharacterized protein LOC119060504 [Artibeus jamaicensis]
MEGFTKAKPLGTGPLYFFDQMKPERKKQGRRECTEHFPYLEHTSGARQSPTKSIKSAEVEKEGRLPTEAAPEKYASCSFAISQTPVVPKFPTGLKFSKIYLQKSLFEEYKLTAAEILHELGETLQKYAEYNITFPMGTVNLVNYSWHDLIEGAYKCPTKKSMLKKHKALQSDHNYMTAIDKISSCSTKECYKDNHPVKIKKDHHHTASGKSTEKTSLVSHTQYSQSSQNPSLPDAIHFSLSSKTGLENENPSRDQNVGLKLSLQWDILTDIEEIDQIHMLRTSQSVWQNSKSHEINHKATRGFSLEMSRNPNTWVKSSDKKPPASNWMTSR